MSAISVDVCGPCAAHRVTTSKWQGCDVCSDVPHPARTVELPLGPDGEVCCKFRCLIEVIFTNTMLVQHTPITIDRENKIGQKIEMRGVMSEFS